MCAWLLGLLACGPGEVAPPPELPQDFLARYAAARCEALVRCDCEPAGFVDAAMCTATLHAQYDERVAALRDAGVVFDPACFADVIAYFESDEACADPQQAAPLPYCSVARGDGEAGDACSSLSLHALSASSCAEPTICAGGERCAEPTTPVAIGLGQPCAQQPWACAEGLWCDAGSDTCRERVAPGSQCDAPAACDASGWCAPEGGTCVARVGAGAACESSVAWDPGPCAPDDTQLPRSFTRWCVDGRCSGRVPAACGPWL
ncbi:MAG: hypothetical protein K1X88_06935 [Nannocystaceae bacterium]|nr:hypothetical protein [Nannocystaceae bacterium]